MSRGPGKMQQFILGYLQMSAEPKSSVQLRDYYEIFEADQPGPRQLGRAIRQLKAAGRIKRDADGNWYPVRNWVARDEAERLRLRIAYHEAGHAVIGLALKLPVAFATIKRRASAWGHVSYAPTHHGVGTVYARGNYRRSVDLSEVDAFGNPAMTRAHDLHADTVMTIAGGAAEAKYMKDGSTWRGHASTGDMQIIGYNRRQLGKTARSIEEYAAECSALVEQHWPKIEAVAAKLLKEETLSGADLYYICWRIARNVVRRQHLEGSKS